MKSMLSFDEYSIPVDHQVRVSTLNALHTPGSLHERTLSICKQVRDIEPDILCLQEVVFEQDDTSLVLKNIAHETGMTIVTALQQTPDTNPHYSGTAILSRLSCIESGSFYLGSEAADNRFASFAVFDHPSGRTVIAVTAHLCWGGDKERERLIQLTAVDARVKELVTQYENDSPMVVLTGDFNTMPQSDSMRFMKGLGAGSDGGYTFWTDAWETLGTPENEATVANDNHWAKMTAKSKDIHLPHLMPNRRIDYVLSYGWSYGKNGSALTFERSFTDDSQYGFPASDHFGLTVDFWAAPTKMQVAVL
jgi:endonuclease/exonuclease/phosphatase family metal-dependent hydrolase